MPSASVFLFTGPNTYALREEKRRWKRQFIEKHGEENFLTLFGDQLQLRHLADEVGAAPFIGEKRLVVVEGIPKFEKEDMESLPSLLHEGTVLVVSDPQPDKRLSATKVLMKLATVKEFTPLARPALRAWVRQYLRERGASMDAAGEELLFSLVGDEQEVLSSELQKLASSPRRASLSTDDVRAVAVPWGEREIWHLTRLLADGNEREALQYAAAMLRQGEDAYSLWNMLLWTLRSLVSVTIACAEGVTQPQAIASRCGVPFPTARNLLPAAKRIRKDALKPLVEWAADADIALKTGGIRATAEGNEELVALIEQLMVRIANIARA